MAVKNWLVCRRESLDASKLLDGFVRDTGSSRSESAVDGLLCPIFVSSSVVGIRTGTLSRSTHLPCASIGAPQPRAQQELATEDIQRQVTIVAVIAMKEPALLISVNQIVGNIQIQNDLCWLLRIRLDEVIHHQPIDRVRIDDDLLVPLRCSRFGHRQSGEGNGTGVRLYPSKLCTERKGSISQSIAISTTISGEYEFGIRTIKADNR